MRKSHPWRTATFGTLTIDPVVSTRSSQFTVYLQTLQPTERRQIEAAERAFVTRAHFTTTSPQQSTARDYAGGMLGVKEDEPADYRGFVS